jgi:hypothetical protein
VSVPPEIAAFSETAARFCSWAEGDAGDPDDDLYLAMIHVAQLYAAVLIMPGADPMPDVVDRYVDKNDHVALYERFRKLPFQFYGDVYDTTLVPPEEPTVGDLADDLLDIYSDVRTGLAHWNAGEFVHAAFHWKFTWGVHWGRHATGALQAMHCFRIKVH